MLIGKLQNPGEQIFGAWKGSNNLNAHDTLLGKCQGHQYWFKTRVVARLFCKIFSFLTGFMLIWLDKLNYMSLIVQVTNPVSSIDYLKLKQSVRRRKQYFNHNYCQFKRKGTIEFSSRGKYTQTTSSPFQKHMFFKI